MATYYLQHYGIKGQKWGVRRFQNKDGRLKLSGNKRRVNPEDYHDDYKKVHNKKSIKTMSDAELRERNNRLQMERQYAELTAKKKRGKQVVNAFIATATTVAAVTKAYRTYKDVGDKVIDKVGDKILKSIDLSKPLA